MSNRPVQPHPSGERHDTRAIDWLMGATVTIAVIVGLAMLLGGCRGAASRGEPSVEATAAPRETTSRLEVTPRPPMVGTGPGPVLAPRGIAPLHRALAYAEAARIQAATYEYLAAIAMQRVEEATPEPTAAATPEYAETVVVQATRQATPVVVEVAPLPPSGSLEQAIAASDWPASLWGAVESVVMCESRGQTGAVSPGGHLGLLQVDPSLHGPVPADAVGQLNDGYDVYLEQGWAAWECAS